jgi:hypothetical protein
MDAQMYYWDGNTAYHNLHGMDFYNISRYGAHIFVSLSKRFEKSDIAYFTMGYKLYYYGMGFTSCQRH